MENKIARLETLRFKGKSLWISYFKETNIRKASQILKQWNTTMDKIHAVQDEVNKLLFSNLSALGSDMQ